MYTFVCMYTYTRRHTHTCTYTLIHMYVDVHIYEYTYWMHVHVLGCGISTHCNMWHINTLQHTATHVWVTRVCCLCGISTHWNALHHTTMHYNTCVSDTRVLDVWHINTLKRTASHYNALQHTATHECMARARWIWHMYESRVILHHIRVSHASYHLFMC